MKNITAKELFSTMLLFEIGNTILFAHGISAKQDSWIAILFAMITSLPLLYIYLFLFNNLNMNLTQILENLLGKFLGIFISSIYALYFFFMFYNICTIDSY